MENDEEDIGTPVITPTILPYEKCVLRIRWRENQILL